MIGFFSREAGIIQKVKAALVGIYGRTDFESGLLNFTHTDYYEKEMGRGLKRVFLTFEKPVSLENIYAVKLKTNRMEKRFAKDSRRTVNIDPGYMTPAKLVLLSTKDYSHRIYLKKGIFAEVTLSYRDGSFRPWPWTYPDYKSAPYIELFDNLRRERVAST